MSSPSRGPVGVLKRVLVALVAAGVVIGFWRWTGQGSDVTDPGWLDRTTETVTDFGESMKDLISQLGDQVG
ncbi:MULTISPECIES: hypothetical protein [unclassified Streptomyces]|uniref:hypothetical protein n=1 Tax=unclassified Streptomyces TaxID=2593676 RepID=UPI00139DAE88|nr:hypothetical protein [Streptomyces sp.]MYT22386.1 hypothetical protein [Streptomyces sp. SID7760]HWU11056.1 hypothetical protein [Streptomyces sp.]